MSGARTGGARSGGAGASGVERGDDRLVLRGLRLVARHGVLAEEHDRPQPFEVDVEIEADLSAPGSSDDLADTIDYGAVTASVAAAVQGPHAELLEHLAQRIAEATFSVAGLQARAVVVTVRKLRPPVPFDLAGAEVSIRRVNPLMR